MVRSGRPEPNEPVFHAEWERRAFAITLAMGDARRLEHRHVALRPRGSLRPQDYLCKSYYQIWLAGLERLMLERGLIAVRRDRSRQAAASGQTGGEDADAATASPPCCIGADRPSARPTQPCSLRRRRSRARENDPSADPYAAAALCARPCRRRRARARLSRLSRQQRASAPAKIRNGSTP